MRAVTDKPASVVMTVWVVFLGVARADVSVAEIPGDWAACEKAMAPLQERGAEVEQAEGALVVTYHILGGDRCLSGSDYRLSLRKEPGREPRWNALESDDGVKRRWSRRLGKLRAVIDTIVWDGPDESAAWVPLLKRAARDCARLVH